MLNAHDINRMFLELEERYRRDQQNLETRYQREKQKLADEHQRDRDALERVKALAGRPGVGSGLPVPQPLQMPLSGRLGPTRSGKKTDRQIIREFLSERTGNYTIADLISAAERGGRKEAAAIDKNVWSSTIYWLVKNGLVAVVEERRGNLPGTYKVAVSRDEMIAPKRKPKKNEFPLQSLVFEGIQRITTKRFGRKELTEFILKQHPEHADRITVDLVGASLYRLFNEKKTALKRVEQSKQGNVYEKP